MKEYDKKHAIMIFSILVVLLLLISSFSIVNKNNSISALSNSQALKSTINFENFTNNAQSNSITKPENSMVKFVYPLNINNSQYLKDYTGTLSVLITFKLNNETELLSYLENLSSPGNAEYHKYLTKSMFEKLYSPSSYIYNESLNYFKNFGANVQSYADRISISITGSSTIISKIFNVSFGYYSNGENQFYSITQEPLVPAWMAPYISQIAGLDNYYQLFTSPDNFCAEHTDSEYNSSSHVSGYPIPIASNGVQYIYGSDLQVAYDEQSLLNLTYPTNEVIATILRAGQYIGPNITTPYGILLNGTVLGPFNPSDIYTYYNDTLPAWEPHSKVYGVPIAGAPLPGPLSSYDTNGAVGENTLDLEMAGSTAPGATIFNVYGQTLANADQAFAYILNPNSSFSKLNNVSVISNSWGGPEYNDTAWYEYLQEAQTRGISVLASSGDSADNAASGKYDGSNYGPNDWLEFPSAMAYDSFGVTAVGGTTLTLTSILQIENQIVWNATSSSEGPVGSTGGISHVFPEPIWQLNSMANNVLNGEGRGVPDIAAIANNTIVYITVNGVSYYGNPEFYYFWGTSVASPLEAGLIAEMDAVLAHFNHPKLGFLNPMIYKIANEQFAPFTFTNNTGFIQTGPYNSTLPLTAFYDVMSGRNNVYNAFFAYDLVTGWGSIDAYNLTMYLLNVNYTGKPYALNGVENIFNLSGLNVTSYIYNSTSNTYSVNTYFNASIQQNMFVADALGAPIYWIQNVIYINGSQQTGWAMNYSGWVVYPFYGIYYNQIVYEYNYPLGKIVTLPQRFDIKTWLSNLNTVMGQMVNFQVNSQILQLPVPGAAFIIGSYNYTYYWQGQSYYNGPFPDNSYQGGLDPEFGLVGGPSGGLGLFEPPTAGNMTAYIEPMGSNHYIKPITIAYNYTVDQTGESAQNLQWSESGPDEWTLGILNSSTVQGVLSYNSPYYQVSFNELGLPANTPWFVNITGEQTSGAIMGSFYSTALPNGSYTYSISTTNKEYQASGGAFTVNGKNVSIEISFSLLTYSVTFTETGLPNGVIWYVNLTNGQLFSSSTNTITFTEVNSTYSYTIATANKEYEPLVSFGQFRVNGTAVSEPVIFKLVTYTVKFTETGLPSGTSWAVAISSDANTSNTSTIIFTEPNGTYSFTVATLNKYFAPTPLSGSFTVKGANIFESITFSLVTYGVTFTEYGLPLGTVWSVNITSSSSPFKLGFSSIASPESYISFLASNGTYTYRIWVTNKQYLPSPSSGSFTVNGTNASESISFLLTFNVTFTESGLPSKAIWYVNLTNGQSFSSSTNTITFREPNNTYRYAVATNDTFYAPTLNATGLFTVNGANVQVNVKFILLTYSVTFTESGLPSGTLWGVTLNGVSLNSTTNTITFTEMKGAYSFTITSANKEYTASPPSGSFTVTDANVSTTITFSMVMYTITFTESGLPSGTTWAVTLEGVKHSSTTNTITFTEPNGTYNYTISLPSGYKTISLTGTIKTTTSPINVVVPVSATTSTPFYYILIVIVLVIVVVILAVIAVVLTMKKRKKKRGITKWQGPEKGKK